MSSIMSAITGVNIVSKQPRLQPRPPKLFISHVSHPPGLDLERFHAVDVFTCGLRIQLEVEFIFERYHKHVGDFASAVQSSFIRCPLVTCVGNFQGRVKEDVIRPVIDEG
jgi:hypothetical protein